MILCKKFFCFLVSIFFVLAPGLVFADDLTEYLSREYPRANNTGCWCKEAGEVEKWNKAEIGKINPYVTPPPFPLAPAKVLEDGQGCDKSDQQAFGSYVYVYVSNITECRMKFYDPCTCALYHDEDQGVARRVCRPAQPKDILDYPDLIEFKERGSCDWLQDLKYVTYCCCKETKNVGGVVTMSCGSEQKKVEDEAICTSEEGVLKTVDELNALDAKCGSSYTTAESGEAKNTGIGLSLGGIKESAKGLNPLSLSAGKSGMIGLVGRAIKLLVAFIGTIAFSLYIYAGLLWMTSAGNSGQVDKAKNILIWATLGVIVMLGSYVLVDFLFKSVG